MKTFQEFITEIKRYNLRRKGGDPFTHSGGYKPLKPLDLSAIHKMGDEAAKSTAKAKEQREKKNRQFDTRKRMDAAGKKLGLPEGVELDEGMTMKDFKANRRKLRRREASADAEKRGHVGKEWYNSGRKYSPDEAKRMRSKLDDEERSTRHRSAIDPEGDDSDYSANRTKNAKKLRKQKAMGELGEERIDELFITRKSAEEKTDEKRKKKVAELIRLMKHAKDPSSDVAARSTKTEEYIDETSLTRVMSKSQKGGMAIMSAQRGDKSKAENKARSKQLEKDVRGAGLPGPTKVAGRYTENPGTPQEKKVGEKSHVITPGKKGKRKFKKAIEKLGKKYDQDSVLIQRKKGGEATLKGTSKTSWPGQGKNVKIGKMKPGRTGEFDTKVKNKTFTVEH
jgi:hypothetical protein